MRKNEKQNQNNNPLVEDDNLYLDDLTNHEKQKRNDRLKQKKKDREKYKKRKGTDYAEV